ncbi:hypothetical protein [Acidovorax sp. FG27]|uniref:hypothetical protein n=1 Tax=Acidovorax sp. FG27 TaxID=3133652 RepID=UPI00333EA9CB
MEGHLFACLDGASDLFPGSSAYGELGESRVPVVFVDGVDLRPLALCDGNGLQCADALLAILFGRVLCLAVLILVPALGFVHPVLLWHGVFHGAGVLLPHLVVGNPASCAAGLPLLVSSALVLMGKLGLSSFTKRMCRRCPMSMFRPWKLMPVVTMPYGLLGLTWAWKRP